MAADLEDCKITITTTNGGQYSGTVNKVDEIDGNITLRNVSTEGAKLYGPLQFCVSKIKSMEIDRQTTQTDGQTKRKDDSNFLRKHKKINQPHLHKLKNLDTDKLATCQSIFADHDEFEDCGETVAEDDYEDFYETEECTLICRVGEKFYDAITYVMRQEEVAVTFEGVNICRDGTLSLIQVATSSEVIIFDMLRLGEAAFVEGLHFFFESGDVCKIMHDCRWISDILFHVYGVTLNNVFDTQVACAYVYSLNHNGDWPRHVESLDGALRYHLGLAQEEVFSMRVRERSKTQDQQMWLHRPVPERLLKLTCKNIRYLFPLQKSLQRKMMLVFDVGVRLYLDHIRKATPGNIEKLRTMSHLLPMAFSDMSKFVQCEINDKMDHLTWQDKKYSSYDANGFRFNVLKGGKGNDIICSHDSIWHRSEEYYAPFRKRPINPTSASSGLPPEERNRRRFANSSQNKAIQGGSHLKNLELPSTQRVAENHTSHTTTELEGVSAKESPKHERALRIDDSPLPCLIADNSQSDHKTSLSAFALPKTSDSEISPPTSKVCKSRLFQLLQSPTDSSPESKVAEVMSLPEGYTTQSPLVKSRAVPENPALPVKSVATSEEACRIEERERCERALSQLDMLKFMPVVKQTGGQSSRHAQVSPKAESTSNLDFQLKHIRQKTLYSDGASKSSTQSSSEETGEILSFQPAGAKHSHDSKKRAKGWQGRPAGHSKKDLVQMSSSSTPSPAGLDSDNEEEMGAIPMHQTLHRKQPGQHRSLGGPSAIGDPFQIDTEPDTLAETQALLLPSRYSLGQLETEAISDAELEQMEQTEMYKKTLQQTLKLAASSTGSSGLKTRLVPSKLKLALKPRLP